MITKFSSLGEQFLKADAGGSWGNLYIKISNVNLMSKVCLHRQDYLHLSLFVRLLALLTLKMLLTSHFTHLCISSFDQHN